MKMWAKKRSKNIIYKGPTEEDFHLKTPTNIK